MLQSRILHTMQGNDRRRRSSKPLHAKSLPTLWYTPKGDLRQRYALYGQIYERTVPNITNLTKYQQHVSSTNRWTVRTDKSMGRTIPTNLHKWNTNRLEQLTPNRTIHLQCVA